MDPIDFQKPLRNYFQKRRFKNFVSDYQSCKTILDVGGGSHTWEILGRSSGVTILNILPPKDPGGFTFVQGSACDIPFPDKSFDLAFSNSAIEHAGSEENQFKFASEMMRVGKRIYCQTPSRLFPVDPHLTAPFLHWLPNSWLTPRFLRYFTLNGWLLGKPYQYDVTWISKRKLQKMFPGLQDQDRALPADARNPLRLRTDGVPSLGTLRPQIRVLNSQPTAFIPALTGPSPIR